MTIDEFLAELEKYTDPNDTWSVNHAHMIECVKHRTFQCPITYLYNEKFPEGPLYDSKNYDFAASVLGLSPTNMRKIVAAADNRLDGFLRVRLMDILKPEPQLDEKD